MCPFHHSLKGRGIKKGNYDAHMQYKQQRFRSANTGMQTVHGLLSQLRYSVVYAQSDQGLCHQLTKSLDTTECMNGKQRPG